MEWKLFIEEDKSTHPPVGSKCLIFMDDRDNYQFGYKVVEIVKYKWMRTENGREEDDFDYLNILCKNLDADEYSPDSDDPMNLLSLWDIDIKKYAIIEMGQNISTKKISI